MRNTLRLVLYLLLLPTSLAFVSQYPFVTPPQVRQSCSLSMSLRPVYDELCSTLTNKLGLRLTDFCESLQANVWNGPTAEGTAAWWSEASPQYLTGISTCTRINHNGDGSMREELMINVWMGPSYDTPHMLVTFGEGTNGQYHVTSDYVPRGAVVMGGDPQYLEKYYGADVQQTWQQAHQRGVALPPASEFDSRLLDSPALISVTGLSASVAEELVRTHVNRFLSWLDAAQPIPARLRGSFNLRDDKLRQFYYKGQVLRQVLLLGDGLGQTVAAVNTGPTAEAYVGGGS